MSLAPSHFASQAAAAAGDEEPFAGETKAIEDAHDEAPCDVPCQIATPNCAISYNRCSHGTSTDEGGTQRICMQICYVYNDAQIGI